MKLLIVCSTLDLKYRLGCTPSWWQLFKALHENGNEVVTIPFLGDPVESLWWRAYPNPCALESKAYNHLLEYRKALGARLSVRGSTGPGNGGVLNRYIRKRWADGISTVLEREKDTDAVLFISVPISYLTGIAGKIRDGYSLPVSFFEGDMPIALPSFVKDSGYRFSYYEGADLSEFDAFFTNSRGVIPELEELGARNIHPLYYAADPSLFQPVPLAKDHDISFFGYGTGLREDWIRAMITDPSEAMGRARFAVGGKDMPADLGSARFIGDLSYSAFRDFCCRSRICLNITRSSHASVFASSSARPFELAAFGACIVSNPCLGMEEWFEPGRELLIVQHPGEIADVYSGLLDSEEDRARLGEAARRRVLKDHTYGERAAQLVDVIQKIRSP